MATLQETARLQFENNKRARRVIYAQAASRGNELRQRKEPGRSSEDATDSNPKPSLNRLRSGSGTSTSDSTTDFETPSTSTFLKGSTNRPHQSSLSSSNSSQPSVSSTHTSRSAQMKPSSSPLSPPTLSKDTPPLPPKDATPRISPSHSMQQLSSPTITFPSVTPPRRNPSIESALSPVVSRMRKRDADAIAQYMSRNRTLSGGDHTSSATSSTRSVSPVESRTKLVGRSALRPSVSAAALRMPEETSKDEISASPGQLRFRSTTIDLPGPPEANPRVTVGLSSRERLRPRETPSSGVDTGGSTARRRV
ncbi:hypothetical protein BS47DRAFT_976367 [Hydnum rufescens UP504]|uniref:Uncharacterized protein n=1 Tax=Hydnum rufescens UP504 TaxID=1448309 RepID=A0A9P6AX59_9AGAM|nr:hypothetical protein BS47DRAFT_976367 [Hydnum rufescens UP504]